MLRKFCLFIFRLRGWKFENHIPDDLRSFVFVGAPHTSNFDIIPAMAVAELLNRNARFVIKNDWLKFPFGLIMKPAGAIGLDRERLKGAKGNTTGLFADLFKEHRELVLMISPEGTRSPNPNWKTGFYYIAEKAGVPIVCGFADYKKKVAGVGLVVNPTNFEEDMKKISEFFRSKTGKNPQNFALDSRFN